MQWYICDERLCCVGMRAWKQENLTMLQMVPPEPRDWDFMNFFRMPVSPEFFTFNVHFPGTH